MIKNKGNPNTGLPEPVSAKMFIDTKTYNRFKKFLNDPVISKHTTYRIDEDGKRIPVKEVIDEQPRDLKATIALFEKMYPQYFDPITAKKLLETDENKDKSLEERLRDTFTIDDEDEDDEQT